MLQHSRNKPRNRKKKKNLPYFGCDFSGWFSFRKIIRIIANRCHILKLKCTEFDFQLGELTALPRPPSWRPTCNGKEGEKEEGKGPEEGKKSLRAGKGKREREGKERSKGSGSGRWRGRHSLT